MRGAREVAVAVVRAWSAADVDLPEMPGHAIALIEADHRSVLEEACRALAEWDPNGRWSWEGWKDQAIDAIRRALLGAGRESE